MTAILIAGWVSTLTLGALLVIATMGNQDVAAENRRLKTALDRSPHPDFGLELAATRHGHGGVVVRTTDRAYDDRKAAEAELAAMVAAEEAVVRAAGKRQQAAARKPRARKVVAK